jgi:hypothetical protein
LPEIEGMEEAGLKQDPLPKKKKNNERSADWLPDICLCIRAGEDDRIGESERRVREVQIRWIP